MKKILKDSSAELVVIVRSPLIAGVGALGGGFVLVLLVAWVGLISLRDEQVQGLAGALVTCGLSFLVFYERSDFSFDARTRQLTWSRRRGLRRKGGTVPFESIAGVVLQSCAGNEGIYPSLRVVLRVKDGDLPLMLAYEPDEANEAIARRVREFLGMSPGNLLGDSVEALVRGGRDVDAIRLLREREGLSLEEAHRRVKGMGQRR